ncbi:MAG: NAD(P)-binding domain-containing protein [Planctomycetia bacterium]|nr:NAD(P)-binding domain-containing protein [Planctomycetia bacterium]
MVEISSADIALRAKISVRKACIIGAGSSGIAACKTLHERGIPYDCFELGSGIGGMWRYQNDNGLSSAYRSLHINTSRDTMAYSDFPLPRDWPPFPDHGKVLQYFESYVDHFGIRETITFRTKVEQVTAAGNGDWDVTVVGADGVRRTNRYGAVLVANGHHWNPRLPSFPGEFHGQQLHSHDYREPSRFVGKRVLVVGFGNSSCDIACEASRVAEAAFMSVRRGAHVIPKYMFGWPMDTILPPFIWKWLPWWAIRPIFGAGLWMARGKMSWYGIPEPEHRILQEHPTISADIFNVIGHGYLQVKPNLQELCGDSVRFVDGSVEKVDVIVWCTGYNITFPFLDASVLDPMNNEVSLYQQVVHPDQPGLYFIGLVQPWGAIMPLAEAQAIWVADVLRGTSGLPDRETMVAEIKRHRASLEKRYTKSTRHTIQVDFYPYRNLLAKTARRGRHWPKRPLNSHL